MTAIKVEYINPFLKATKETFASMVGLDIIPGKPFLRNGNEGNNVISGVIGLSGKMKGAVVINFPETTAIKAVSTFIGAEIDSLDEDVTDAVGELANIIAGYAKKDLEQYNLALSLPTVIKGENYRFVNAKGSAAVVIPFKSDAGDFDLAVSLVEA